MEWVGILIICVFVMMVLLFVASRQQDEYESRVAKARREYQIALDALEENPKDTRYRITALEAGRNLASVCREKNDNPGATVFDEVALQNDIHARCGSGSSNTSNWDL